MRPTLFLIPCFFLPFILNAQIAKINPALSPGKEALNRRYHVDLLMDAYYPFAGRFANATSYIKIPYGVRDLSTGIVYNKAYETELRNPYSRSTLGINLLTFRHAWKRYSYTFGIGTAVYFGNSQVLHKLNGISTMLGTDYIFFMNKPFQNRGDKWTSNQGRNYHPGYSMRSPIHKLIGSFGITFYSYSFDLDLPGNIGNYNREIIFPSFTAGSQFTYTTQVTSNNGNGVQTQSSATHTTNADHVDLHYNTTSASIMPQFSISNDHGLKNSYWKVYIGWMIPLYTNAYISVTQYNGDGRSHGLSDISLYERKFFHENWNSSMYSTRFSFGGPVLGFVLGWRIRRDMIGTRKKVDDTKKVK